MGFTVCQAVNAASDLDLVTQIDQNDSLDLLIEHKVDVMVDFTAPEVVMGHLEFALANNIHCVVGTTGWTPERLDQVRALQSKSQANVLIAPNFGLAAVLMMQFAAKAAPYFESVEIVELHHPRKADAPSGTARRTAELINEARAQAKSEPMPDATREELDGARGAVIGDVRVHAVRLQGLVAHQEVILGGPGESLTIRHDSYDRESFMPGVILAVREIAKHPGLIYGLEDYLGL
jgi:4-hydroxy-tetrahydrodipicolinate reductase